MRPHLVTIQLQKLYFLSVECREISYHNNRELKREVNAVHERTTKELAQKITKSSYQFKKKAL